MRNISKNKKGLTLVEVLIGIFLLSVVFSAIFSLVNATLKLTSEGQNKAIATAIASGEIELIRNLPYESVGVIDGFPSGTLEPTKEKISNGRTYTIETTVDYIIDPLDGLSSPQDECPNDYKKAQIKVSWSAPFNGSVIFTTDIAPANLSQECAEGGGILSVSVFDAFGAMIFSPLIEIKDPATGQIIKNAMPTEGQYYFALPPGTYKIAVSKEGYNSDMTYGIDEIAIPTKPNPSVLENEVTEISFSIDELSSISVLTLSPWAVSDFADSFSDSSKTEEYSDVLISNGEVTLQKTGEDYLQLGQISSIGIEPENLLQWNEFSWQQNIPANTSIKYQILYWNEAAWILIPEGDLPGNAEGFSTSPLNLSNLDVNTYYKIKLKAILSTDDVSVTPILYEWFVSWKNSGNTPAPNVLFNIHGEKLIGRDAEENPVYKYSENNISGSNGAFDLSNLEWDSYTFSIESPGLDLENTNPAPQPIGLQPDISLSVNLYVGAQNSLLITVKDSETGEPVFSAAVRIYNGEYDTTRYTNEKGQSYFIPLEEGNYNLEVRDPNYLDADDSVYISDDVSKIMFLSPID